MTLNQIKTLFEREYNSTFEGDFATYENGEYVDERQQDFFDGFNAGIKKQSALIAILLKPLQACDDAMEYMSEYDIPIALPTQVKEALQAARDSGYWNEKGE